ncbi:bec14fb9-d14d-4b39-9abf-e2732f5aa296 [Thermothielavioides terrestris]|uniref:Bec14fb9-d14d-4b39-9abf-e2732f5aa296 n=1 Tax=Thermothielavioides terrestris TaxID=2587410 RepID=A0A446B9C4_9PEZI|nr:bec14fb9-d14d-4b39-9abf-e2732f5aa296 [Thermothielavioides terrestris]
MAPGEHNPAARSGLPSSSSLPSSVEQLAEDLSLQKAVLDSLLDLPQSASTREDIAAVKAEIANIKRQLAKARSTGNECEDGLHRPGRSTDPRHIDIIDYWAFGPCVFKPGLGFWAKLGNLVAEAFHRELTSRRRFIRFECS